MRRLGLLVLAAALVATGCASAALTATPDVTVTPAATPELYPNPAPTSTPMPTPMASSGPTVTPSPSPDLKAVAAAQYLSVTTAYNKAVKGLWNSKACKGRTWSKHTLKQWKTCYGKAAQIDRAWADGVRAIEFPPELAGDVSALLRSAAQEEALMISASHSRSWADLYAYDRKISKADEATRGLSNALRGALGLPSVS